MPNGRARSRSTVGDCVHLEDDSGAGDGAGRTADSVASDLKGVGERVDLTETP